MAAPEPGTGFRPIPDNLPALQRPPPLLPAEEARERYWNLVALVAIAAAALAGLGWWSYDNVRGSMRELRAAGLASYLESESKVLTLWFEEKKLAAERWSVTGRVQVEAAELARLAGETDAGRACRSPARQALVAEIAPFVKLEAAVAVNLFARNGDILAALHDEYCGLSVAGSEFAALIAPVFDGRTVFVRPFAEVARVGASIEAPYREPLVWVITPMRDAEGRVVAGLGFGRRAKDGFDTLLANTQSQSSRESYAMDAAGHLLTRSRYLGDLRRSGLVPPDGDGVLQAENRDPGGDVVAGYVPPVDGAERPRTRLATEAIESAAPGASREGAILDPYRNYRGAEVIGAWRWLPLKDMAVVVEIDAAEAYAPLRYLETAFGLLMGFMAAAVLAALASGLWAMRLKQREARRVGQYTLEREIGEGGISRVHLARHSHLKRPTAVKVLKAALATDEMVTRFEREVQLSSRLTHPNTIEIYDYGRTRDGTFYYAMEYLEGLSLEEIVTRDGPMPASRAAHLLLQACGALHEAHQRGLVHRDVKPQNLMVCRLGGQHDFLKVLDFGLVKDLGNDQTRDLTQFARMLGTPLYMAPERIRNPADADARADIYALGAVAFFLLTGRRVFEAASDLDLVNQVLNSPPRSPTQAGAADVPPLLDSLVLRCLAKDRGQRPATIAEVAAVLREVARARPWREEMAAIWWASRASALGVLPLPPEGTASG
jgi:serine/threonine-protein kinase